MNRLEYSEVINAVNINGGLLSIIEQIYFSKTYYTVIKGRIPLEVANIIYEKYPENPYRIRVDGGCVDWNPNEHIPVNTYHIDTKEGLVIMLTELKDYLARKQGIVETEVQRFDELMETINMEILKKVNPSISTHEWMQEMDGIAQQFEETISQEKKYGIKEMFRSALDKFDKTINPFIDKNIELDKVGNYIKKVNISANIYAPGNDKGNCCEMHIVDLKTKNNIDYHRNPDGFSYQLQYTFRDDQYLTVLHYYSTYENDENGKGEVIVINYFGKMSPTKVDISYNLTQDTILENGKRKPISPEQIIYFYDEILKATELASSITIDNMKKTGILKNKA